MTATEEITIRVDADTAQRFRDATPERRKKVERMIRLSLEDDRAIELGELTSAMNAAAAEAAANGLTDELLADILRECHDDRRP